LISRLRKTAILFHRWLGVAFCALFLTWFLSGFGMMYWDYPEVSAQLRLSHAEPIDAARVHISPQQAFARLDLPGPPAQARILMYDGRPAYRFRYGRRQFLVFADDGTPQRAFPLPLTRRIAAAWTGQPESFMRFEGMVADQDQWTLEGLRGLFPFDKYSWPDGQEVYVSQVSGEVAQYTTRASRLGAYLGPIPHWLYFTPLRRNGRLWGRTVIWLSAAGAVTSLLGLIVGVWMYSPSKGSPIPYSGQKRWHMIFGLVFGLTTFTWVSSGLLSMEPFDRLSQGPEYGPSGSLRGEPDLDAFAAKTPQEAVAAAKTPVKELELTEFDGDPVYLVTEASGSSLVIPVHGNPAPEFDPARLTRLVAQAAEPYQVVSVRVVRDYEAYYIARHGELPLPVLCARLNDPQASTFYIDPKTARVVASYGTAARWNRWLYHGWHSFNLPWLYKYRPAWDALVLALLTGGTALCYTSVIIAWRLLRRKLGRGASFSLQRGL
jgi:hypothetical protein